MCTCIFFSLAHMHTHTYVYTMLFSSRKHFCKWYNAKMREKKNTALVSYINFLVSVLAARTVCCVCMPVLHERPVFTIYTY
jgi:hypothetical protein